MTPTNTVILKMVLNSPVGQAMSDADRDALKQTLETTDARDVQGWLGNQIQKAAAIFKGDYDGHPFRGNQHSDSSGASQGGAGGSAKGSSGSKGPRATDLKEGDFADLDTQSGNYVGTILGIKDGVISFDDVDKGEISIKLKTITHMDGDKVKEDDSAGAGKKRVAALDAKLKETKQQRERSAREESQANADIAGMSLRSYQAAELRTFIDEQKGLLEVMQFNGESDKRLKQQRSVISQAKRDLKTKKTK